MKLDKLFFHNFCNRVLNITDREVNRLSFGKKIRNNVQNNLEQYVPEENVSYQGDGRIYN